jgi:hypothetical protein
MSSRAGIVMFVLSTSACGVLAFSTDELSNGRVGGDGEGGISQVLPDGQSATEGGVVADGAVGVDGLIAPSPDAQSEAPNAPAGCPANPCTAGSVCCYVSQSATSGDFVCQGSCPDNRPVECVGPQQCGSGAVCCGTVRFGSGSVPNCPIDALSSQCVDKCQPNWGLSCNVTNTMRLCHEKADCASDPEHPNCCTYNGSGVTAIVCVSDVIRDFAGLSCLP